MTVPKPTGPLPLFEPITREFTNRLKADMRDAEAWARHLAPDRIHRTEAALRKMRQSIQAQMKAHGDPDNPDFDPDWFHRTRAFYNVIENRLQQVAAVSNQRVVDRREYDKLVESLTLYKHFAWELAVELEECGPKGVEALHDIMAPGGQMDAMAWLDQRTDAMEKQEEQKAAERAREAAIEERLEKHS